MLHRRLGRCPCFVQDPERFHALVPLGGLEGTNEDGELIRRRCRWPRPPPWPVANITRLTAKTNGVRTDARNKYIRHGK